ncbi:MAG: hypothetical protein A3F68_04350 [Acidobacteria bacterium RIFCSPLOWO2_12_FULL_54_10]|nr:MAG: hypothetical protein A3F68_04350 [Acidobacteria bacterium RIFCSPLOWO2_12_FULL_54_10]
MRDLFRVLALAILWFSGFSAAVNQASAQQHGGGGAAGGPSAASLEGLAPPPEGMSFFKELDHTAVWIGDPFHYKISIVYSDEYEFVLDTLTKETVNLEPFEVKDLSKTVVKLKDDNNLLTVDLALASYTTGEAVQQIPQLTLFYFKRSSQTATAQEAAAESLTVPGLVLALRSPLEPDPTDIRDGIAVLGWESSLGWIAWTGYFALVVLFVGGGWETTQYIKMRKALRGPDRRKAMQAIRERWSDRVPSSFSDTRAIMDFYDHSYRDLKEFLGFYLETPTSGLTSEDFSDELKKLAADPGLTEASVRALSAMELARYAAANGASVTSEGAQRLAQDIRNIFEVQVQR